MNQNEQDWKEVIQVQTTGYEDDNLTEADWIAYALRYQAEGFEIITRQPNQLLLDLDSEYSVEVYQEQKELMSSLIKEETSRWRSKSGNLHVVLTLYVDVTEMEAIALQSILGSDPQREFLNIIRIHNGIEKPTRLFKPPSDYIKRPSFTDKDIAL